MSYVKALLNGNDDIITLTLCFSPFVNSIFMPQLFKAKRVVLLGLGPEGKDKENDFLSKVGSTLASQCDSHKKVSSCVLVLPSTFATEEDFPLEDLSAHFYSTLYNDNRYRTKANVQIKAEDLKSVTIVTEGTLGDAEAANTALKTGKGISKGVSLAKDIVNAPHNVLNSESLANVAKQIAEESGGTITCTILGKEECEERGMGAYLGVARGSETEPQFIHLTYLPKSGKARYVGDGIGIGSFISFSELNGLFIYLQINCVSSKKVGIIGKGLLFDTGGYNIKTAMMELMKFDCGGSVSFCTYGKH
jgi:leucyl aminopeptidase